MHKLILFYSLFFVVIASLAHAGGDEEDQLLNTNACVNCDLSNAWLEEAKPVSYTHLTLPTILLV